MKTAVIQQSIFQKKAENIEVSITKIQEAASQGAELVVLQELHTTIYFCHIESTDYFDLAESLDGPSIKAFRECAKTCGVVLVTSIFEKRAPGIYHNTAVVIERDGSIAGIYRKMHIPDDPGFYEKFYFTPGDLGFEPIETSVGRLGVLICWDQWYPEAARLMALKGAEVLIYPTAIGWDESDTVEEQQRQCEAWELIQRSHGVANGIPVLVANRVGRDEGVEENPTLFWGNSFIAGEQGEILTRANRSEETILYATLDKQRSDDVRKIWPYFRDRRIDAYEEILKRYCR